MYYKVFERGRCIKTYKTYRWLRKFLDRTARTGLMPLFLVQVNDVDYYDAVPVTFSYTEDSCGWSAEPRGIPVGWGRVHKAITHSADSKLSKILSYGEQR